MERLPRISVVTPYFDLGADIAETVRSVTEQDYPNLEHLVVSADSSNAGLRHVGRSPHVTVVPAPRRRWVEAVNDGFSRATGDILGSLHPGDTLGPGTLRGVARELGPTRAFHVVIGQCRFLDRHGRFVGIAHPSRPEVRLRVLQVWRGRHIPPPAMFWTREAWQTCGPFDDTVKSPWIDYDLLCRLSQRYRLRWVDQAFASCPFHQGPRTELWTDPEQLKDGIEVSRRYWGSPLTPTYWRLRLSLATFRLDRLRRSRRNLAQSQQRWRQGQIPQALGLALTAATLAPEVAFYVSVYPRIRDWTAATWTRGLERLRRLGSVPPETAVHLDRTEVWSDGWVGPRLVVGRHAQDAVQAVILRGWTDLRHLRKPLILTVSVDDRIIGWQPIWQAGDFTLRFRLPALVAPGLHTVKVDAGAWFVPHRFTRSEDVRPLAWRMTGIELESARSTP